MANLFNPLADYLKPQNTTVPFAAGVAPTYAPSVPQKQKSNWLDKYVNDPSISEEGKKNLMEDIENGVLSEASADEVIKDIYREKEPGALE